MLFYYVMDMDIMDTIEVLKHGKILLKLTLETIDIQTVNAQNSSCVGPLVMTSRPSIVVLTVVMRPPVWSLVLAAAGVSGMVRRGHMSDTEVAEIEDMLNTSQMENMDHLDILPPPHSHMNHRHEAPVHY